MSLLLLACIVENNYPFVCEFFRIRLFQTQKKTDETTTFACMCCILAEDFKSFNLIYQCLLLALFFCTDIFTSVTYVLLYILSINGFVNLSYPHSQIIFFDQIETEKDNFFMFKGCAFLQASKEVVLKCLKTSDNK